MIRGNKSNLRQGQVKWDTRLGECHLTGIRQTWQGRVVLDIPHLMLKQGRCYALLGANGSGKSTLLQIMADLLPSEKGETGYLPQKPYAFSMSVARNVELGIPVWQNLEREVRHMHVQSQLDQLELTSLKHARGNRLSGGEAQRMALARLLVVPRQFLLLDEPTNALDLKSLACVEACLQRYLEKQRSLLVLATHQISLARRLCQELIFLDQGKVYQLGPLADLPDACGQRAGPDSRLGLYLGYPGMAKSDGGL